MTLGAGLYTFISNLFPTLLYCEISIFFQNGFVHKWTMCPYDDMLTRAQSLVDQFDRVLGAFLLENGGDHVRLGVRFVGRDADDDNPQWSRISLTVIAGFYRMCVNDHSGHDQMDTLRRYTDFFLNGTAAESSLGTLIQGMIARSRPFDNENILELCQNMDASVKKILEYTDAIQFIGDGPGRDKIRIIEAMSGVIEHMGFDDKTTLKYLFLERYTGNKKTDTTNSISMLLDKVSDTIEVNKLVKFIRDRSSIQAVVSELASEMDKNICVLDERLFVSVDGEGSILQKKGLLWFHEKYMRGGRAGPCKALNKLSKKHMVSILQCLPYSTVQEIFAMGLATMIRNRTMRDNVHNQNANSMLHFADPANAGLVDSERIGQFQTAYSYIRDQLLEHLRVIFSQGIFLTGNPEDSARQFSNEMMVLMEAKKKDPSEAVAGMYNRSSDVCDALFWSGFAAMLRNMAETNHLQRPGIFNQDPFLKNMLSIPMIRADEDGAPGFTEAISFTTSVMHSIDTGDVQNNSIWFAAASMLRVEMLRYIFSVFLGPCTADSLSLSKFSAGPITVSEEELRKMFLAQIKSNNITIVSTAQGISPEFAAFIRKTRQGLNHAEDATSSERQKQLNKEGEDRVHACREAEWRQRHSVLGKGRRAAHHGGSAASLEQTDKVEIRHHRKIQESQNRKHERQLSDEKSTATPRPSSAAAASVSRLPKVPRRLRSPPGSPRRPSSAYDMGSSGGMGSQFTLTPSLQILSDAFDSVARRR